MAAQTRNFDLEPLTGRPTLVVLLGRPPRFGPSDRFAVCHRCSLEPLPRAKGDPGRFSGVSLTGPT